MKKIVALFTAMAFALTLGVAFAAENVPATADKAPAAEKAPAKTAKTAKAKKHVRKHKHEAAPAAGTATK
jgi:hypothetical protein